MMTDISFALLVIGLVALVGSYLGVPTQLAVAILGLGMVITHHGCGRRLRLVMEATVGGWFVVIALLCLIDTAYAAEATAAPPKTLADALQRVVATIVGAAVTAFLGWFSVRLEKWFGLKIEAQHRDALQMALTTAAQLALAAGVGKGTQGLSLGLDYVGRAAPDAIKFFKLSPEHLQDMLVAKSVAVEPPSGKPVDGGADKVALPTG